MIVPSPSIHTHKYISLGHGKITIAMSILFSTHLGIKGRPKFHSFFTVCFDPLRPLIQGAPMGLLIKKSYSRSSKNHLIICRASTGKSYCPRIPCWVYTSLVLRSVYACVHIYHMHMCIFNQFTYVYLVYLPKCKPVFPAQSKALNQKQF